MFDIQGNIYFTYKHHHQLLNNSATDDVMVTLHAVNASQMLHWYITTVWLGCTNTVTSLPLDTQTRLRINYVQQITLPGTSVL